MRAPVTRGDVLQRMKALVWAVRFEWSIRHRTLDRLCAIAGIRFRPGATTTTAGSGVLSRDDLNTARAVRQVFRHWPFGRGSCLREALVLGRLLRYREPTLSIGVRRHEGVVEAHAWLEFDGLVLDPLAADYLRLGSGLGVPGEVEGGGL